VINAQRVIIADPSLKCSIGKRVPCPLIPWDNRMMSACAGAVRDEQACGIIGFEDIIKRGISGVDGHLWQVPGKGSLNP